MAASESITRTAIAATYERIRQHIRRTPVLEVHAEDLGLEGFAPTLKLELTQHSGSFKARGAFANLLLRKVPSAGVAAASGGNHGAAVAYAAMRLRHMALAAGRPVDAPAGGIAADSLAPKRIGERVFPIARRHVATVVLVEDGAIANAQRTLWEKTRIVAEPGAAAPLAALLSEAYVPRQGERIGILISGANTTAVSFDL